MMEDDVPEIMIGTLVRDRAWILSEFLEAISNLDYPKKKISLCFILNDSSDRSGMILQEFELEHSEEYHSIMIDTINLKAPKDIRYNRGKDKIYKSLAMLRNMLVRPFLHHPHLEYLFVIDTDIIVRPGTLNKLLKSKKDIIAAMIKNSARVFNAGYIDEDNLNSINHLTEAPKGLRKVGWTGAVCLYKRGVFEKGAEFEDHPLGEDIGFSLNAKALGIEMWVDGTEILEHKMLFHRTDGSEGKVRNFIKEEVKKNG